MTSSGTDGYTWDARNRLVSTLSGASFQYDAFGRRASKTIGGTTTSFPYDGANAVQEVIGGTNTANSLSGGIDEVFQRTDSAGARSFLTDALGSTLGVTDSAGTLQTQYTYEPFGNTTISGSATTNSFAYTGRELEATGLQFNRARYYNPSLQRFISEDPLGFGAGINFYSYVGNRPVDRVDPSGLLDVYVWNYRGSTDAWGHSSITLADGTHLSWWPSNEGRDFTFGTDKIPIYEAPAFPDQTLEKDIEYEGQGPDKVIHIDGLNEAAIKAWWESFHGNPNNTRKTFGRNCSTVVYDALRAGGGPYTFHPIIWTSSDANNYAELCGIILVQIKNLGS